MTPKQQAARRPFRVGDIMILVAATAVAFAIFRQSPGSGLGFTTFGGEWERLVFFWMHGIVPFPAMWSLGLLAIAVFDRGEALRRKMRHAGNVACLAAVVVLLVTTLTASGFYLLHALEDIQVIPKIFSHPRGTHALPPFANTPVEEMVGPAVVGAWSVMAACGLWRAQPTWIDRAGRALGITWIALYLMYLYGYTG